MKNREERYVLALIVFLGVLLLMLVTSVVTASEQAQLPPARKIPGLTAVDPFPKGCVDCHINMPERNQDERVSTLMARWKKDAGSKLLKHAQSAAPAGMKLTGRHPDVTASLKDIPAACMKCHGRGSKTAPALSPMLHLVHLTGGEVNHYLTIFQGECTPCHKMDIKTGAWTMPSGPER